jgi:hypothetical protein
VIGIVPTFIGHGAPRSMDSEALRLAQRATGSSADGGKLFMGGLDTVARVVERSDHINRTIENQRKGTASQLVGGGRLLI